MLKTFKTTNYIYSNSYIRLDTYVTDDKISFFSNCSIISSNQDESVFSFAKKLQEYESRNNNAVARGQKPRLGVIITFLIDKERPIEQLIELSNEISEHVDSKLPYWSYLHYRNECYYLIFYFSDRYYYPDGIEEEVRATRDIYRSSKNNRVCKKTDQDAYLYKHKGDLIKTRTVIFSNKVRLFCFKSKKDFNKQLDFLKGWYVKTIEELFKFSTSDGLIIKRFIYTDYNDQRQRNNARRWNKAFHDIEKMFDQAIEVLKDLDLYDDNNQKKIEIVFHKIRILVKQKRFCYAKSKNVKGSINLVLPDTIQTAYIDGFKKRCKYEINQAMEKILKLD